MVVWCVLCRSPYSDQNFVGLKNGTVVRAKAITRVIFDVRWNPDRLLNVTTTPLNEFQQAFDELEAIDAPEDHLDKPNTVPEVESSNPRRVPIHRNGLKTHGFKHDCP